MKRSPLRLLKSENAISRTRLSILEKAGLVQEMGDCGGFYGPASVLDQFPTTGDPGEDERLQTFMLKKQKEAEDSRERRLRRLRRLARMDFRMVGGVTPVGFFGGAGGDGGTFRPASIAGRS